jgi:DNA-binding response OmpR family regulator
MLQVALLYLSEGAALLARDLSLAGFEVRAEPLRGAEDVFSGDTFDAVLLEAPSSQEETRRLLELPGRSPRAALVILLRPEQAASFDATWPVDDLLFMPASAEELTLRLRRGVWRKSGVDSSNTLRVGDLVVDLANYKVFVDGAAVSLTFKEFELLRFLMTNRGKVFTREALLNRVWGYEYYGGARTVDVHIRRLRSKIETGDTVYVQTVRNVGYSFSPHSRLETSP